MYCHHCINTSPKLFLKYKLSLLCLTKEVLELRTQISDTLSRSFETYEGMLGNQFRKLDLIKMKRKNNKLKHKVDQLKKRNDIIQQKKDGLQLHVDNLVSGKNLVNKKCNIEEDCLEINAKLLRMQVILKNTSLLKFRQLCQWFIIEPLPQNSQFKYSIRFLPMYNLQNGSKLSCRMESLQYMWEFIIISGKLFSLHLNFYNYESVKIVDLITRLLINMATVLNYLQLLPPNANFGRVLQMYDIDDIFYQICTNKELDYDSILGPTEISYADVYKCISTILDEHSDRKKDNWTMIQ